MQPSQHGILLVDKPVGWSSRKLVYFATKYFQTKKVGHAGTLDPFATGLMALLIGEATKLSRFIMAGNKRYQATLKLGHATTTYDSEGEMTNSASVPIMTDDKIESVLQNFRGKISQTPPQYAAIKVAGKPLYKYARQGQVVDVAPRQIDIFSLKLVTRSQTDEICFDVTCSKGTYIRALGHDLAIALGTYGHLTALRRLASEPYCVDQAMPGQALEAMEVAGYPKAFIDAKLALPQLPSIDQPELAPLLANGKTLPTTLIAQLKATSPLQTGDYAQIISHPYLAIVQYVRQAEQDQLNYQRILNLV